MIPLLNMKMSLDAFGQLGVLRYPATLSRTQRTMLMKTSKSTYPLLCNNAKSEFSIGILSYVSGLNPFCRELLIFNAVLLGNPVNHFPTYQPSEERVSEIAKAFAEENNPLEVHYDASKEIRAKGAGFYQFSADEETRKAQMQELDALREETAKTRQELGAEDIKPGDIEGMRDGEAPGTAGVTKSRAMEKRKRELEERRNMIEAKRKKRKLHNGAASSVNPNTTPDAPPLSTHSGAQPMEVKKSDVAHPTVSSDPFAAFESQALSSSIKGKKKAVPATSEADTFLADLEQEFLGSRIKKHS